MQIADSILDDPKIARRYESDRHPSISVHGPSHPGPVGPPSFAQPVPGDAQLSLLTQLVSQMAQAQLTQTQVRKIPKVPLAKLGPNDDAEAFLTSFERSMAAYRVRCEDWVYLLSSQLTDKALLAYTELNPEKAGSYYHVKEALLQRYAVTPESSRRKFRATTSRPNESMIDLALRVRDLGHRWLRRASSREDVKQLIQLEQYLSALPADLQTWLRERKPNSLMTAAHWAQDYQDARGRNVGAMYRSNRPGDQTLICHHCHLGGHMAKDCPRRQEPSGPRPSAAPEMNRINPRRPVAPAPLRCYNCNERGHIALKCPKSSTPVLYASETKPEQQSVPVKSHPREISKRFSSLASCFARKRIQVQYSITSSQSTH